MTIKQKVKKKMGEIFLKCPSPQGPIPVRKAGREPKNKKSGQIDLKI
jgi:uncharacterized C2H2 Zn-finger protein